MNQSVISSLGKHNQDKREGMKEPGSTELYRPGNSKYMYDRILRIIVLLVKWL